MKAILPVAGMGSRLRPFTHTTPKALMHVAGKPILGHILETLADCGVDHVVLIIGYLGDKIVNYVRTHTDFEVTIIEQPDPQGLGHAIWLARDAVRPDEPVLIVLGDSIVESDLRAVLERGESALAVKEVDEPSRYGIVQLDGDRIVHIVEKPSDPPSNMAVVGLYFLRRSGVLFAALDRVVSGGLRVRGEFQLTDALQMLVESGETLRAFPVGAWLDCGSPEILLQANRHLLTKSQRHVQAPPGVIYVPPVWVDPSARLSDCIVGPYVSVAAGARIDRADVRSSIINEGAQVQEMLLSDSIIGDHAVVTGNYSRLNVGDSSDVRTVR